MSQIKNGITVRGCQIASTPMNHTLETAHRRASERALTAANLRQCSMISLCFFFFFYKLFGSDFKNITLPSIDFFEDSGVCAALRLSPSLNGVDLNCYVVSVSVHK